MNVVLGNCRIVKVDDMNVAVEQYKLVPQSKNPNFRHDGDKYDWMHIGYYANVLQALKKVVNSEIVESDVDGANSLMKKLEELHEEIKNLKLNN